MVVNQLRRGARINAADHHSRRRPLVTTRRPRRALLICAVTLVSLAIPGTAAAIIPTSQITTPAGLAEPFGEQAAKITIAGTAVALTEVDINCYSGNKAPGAIFKLATKVPVAEEKFSVEVPLTELYGLCQLRAVPHGDATLRPPETPQSFEGPIIVPSFFKNGPTSFYAASSTLTGSLFFESAGEFGLESRLYSHAAHENAQFFYGEADLEAFPPIKTRSTVQIDGVDSYVPSAAHEVERVVENGVLPGLPTLTVSKSFNEATRQMTTHEEDPVVKCMPGGAYPPTKAGKASCTSFASTGVTLLRTWETTNKDQVAWMTETWRSTDGHAHSVNARYYTEMWDGTVGGAYQFPGESAFAPTGKGETKTIPAGPGSILYKIGPSTPEAGDGEHPQGAIVYDAAANEPIAVTAGSAASEKETKNVMEVPYQRTVPAGGSATLRMAFVQAFGLPEVRSLAAAALASYPPSVAIGSPANGSSIVAVTPPTVTVSGTASDTGALTSLTVNGKPVAVSAGGTWSTSMALKAGANTITATATDQAGLSTTATSNVTYVPATAKATTVTLSGAKGHVTITLACVGSAGASCTAQLNLTTLEKLRGHRLIGISARRHTTTKRVTVGAGSVTIAAGSRATLTIALNAAGRRLLARFGKLPVRVIATVTASNSAPVTLTATTIIKPAPKKHRKHGH
jgi:hypothetical protein